MAKMKHKTMLSNHFRSGDIIVQTPGGEPTTPEDAPLWDNSIRFVDWDGTILYKFSQEEVAAMTELPPLPDTKVESNYDEGVYLTAGAWNLGLDQIKAERNGIDVVPLYVRPDNITVFGLWPAGMTIKLYFYQGADGAGAYIDWGDGTTDTANGRYESTATHTYSEDVDMCVIRLNPIRSGKIDTFYGVDYSSFDFNDIDVLEPGGIEVFRNCNYLKSTYGFPIALFWPDYYIIPYTGIKCYNKKNVISGFDTCHIPAYEWTQIPFSIPSGSTIKSTTPWLSGRNTEATQRLIINVSKSTDAQIDLSELEEDLEMTYVQDHPNLVIYDSDMINDSRIANLAKDTFIDIRNKFITKHFE